MKKSLYFRLYIMMVKLKVSHDHPDWYSPKGMVAGIAWRLRINDQREGEITVNEETVDWLEHNMPKPKPKKKPQASVLVDAARAYAKARALRMKTDPTFSGEGLRRANELGLYRKEGEASAALLKAALEYDK